MREEYDQILDEILAPLHRRFDQIEKRDVKRRGSIQSTSSKSTYSRRKDTPLVSPKSKFEVEPPKDELLMLNEELLLETYQHLL